MWIRNRFLLLPIIFFLAIVPELRAQAPRAFEVVSVKPDRDGHGLDAGSQPGGRYTARNVSVMFLLTEAFGLKDYQITGTPKTLADERYDIAARANTPNQLSREELKPLLQAMLAERFGLKFRREMREFPAFSLVVSKGGPKISANNISLLPSNLSVSINQGRGTMTGRKMPVSALASHLADLSGRTVIDNTGLKGDYNFKLEWSQPEASDNTFPSIFTAVQEQLGLKLEPVRRAPVEVIVIEHMDKATTN